MKQIVRLALRRGWKLIRGGKGAHYIIEWTDGSRVSLAVTPSDARGIKNAKARLRRIERNSLTS